MRCMEGRELKIGDVHGHVNPLRGMGPRALARRFVKSGGWLYGLVNLTSWSIGVNVMRADDYRRLYKATIKAADEMRKEGLIVPVVLGPHPAEFVRLVEGGVPIEKAAQVIIKAYDIAAGYVKEGVAHGLGEAGRPHWSVPREYIEACNNITRHVLSLSAELEVPVHLHMESSEDAVRDAAALSRDTGAPKVVFHHIKGSLAKLAVELGIIPSVPARRAELEESVEAWPRIVIESDFLDDPKKPGAVVAPWSISRTINKLLAKGLIDESKAFEVLVKNPASLYCIGI